MSPKVQWVTEFETAFEQARKENMAVLLDFFNPE